MIAEIVIERSEASNVSDEDLKLVQSYKEYINELLYCDYIDTDGVDEQPSRRIKIESKIYKLGAPSIIIVLGDYVE